MHSDQIPRQSLSPIWRPEHRWWHLSLQPHSCVSATVGSVRTCNKARLLCPYKGNLSLVLLSLRKGCSTQAQAPNLEGTLGRGSVGCRKRLLRSLQADLQWDLIYGMWQASSWRGPPPWPGLAQSYHLFILEPQYTQRRKTTRGKNESPLSQHPRSGDPCCKAFC